MQRVRGEGGKFDSPISEFLCFRFVKTVRIVGPAPTPVPHTRPKTMVVDGETMSQSYGATYIIPQRYAPIKSR